MSFTWAMSSPANVTTGSLAIAEVRISRVIGRSSAGAALTALGAGRDNHPAFAAPRLHCDQGADEQRHHDHDDDQPHEPVHGATPIGLIGTAMPFVSVLPTG